MAGRGCAAGKANKMEYIERNRMRSPVQKRGWNGRKIREGR